MNVNVDAGVGAGGFGGSDILGSAVGRPSDKLDTEHVHHTKGTGKYHGRMRRMRPAAGSYRRLRLEAVKTTTEAGGIWSGPKTAECC